MEGERRCEELHSLCCAFPWMELPWHMFNKENRKIDSNYVFLNAAALGRAMTMPMEVESQ